MAEEEKRDTVQQPEQGADGVTQKEEKQEDVIFDDKDPKAVLAETARQLGLNPDEISIMTNKELQSYVDSAITRALKSREENLKKQAEIEKMKEKGQYEQLLKQERKEALEDLKNTYLQAKGLPEEFGVLISIEPLADLTLTEAKEQLTSTLNAVSQKLNEIVELKVNERLKNMEKGTFATQTDINRKLPTDPKEALKKIFQDK